MTDLPKENANSPLSCDASNECHWYFQLENNNRKSKMSYAWPESLSNPQGRQQVASISPAEVATFNPHNKLSCAEQWQEYIYPLSCRAEARCPPMQHNNIQKYSENFEVKDAFFLFYDNAYSTTQIQFLCWLRHKSCCSKILMTSW